jgi:hypothetical protein
MKKLSLLCTGVLYACLLVAQPSFQTSLEAGFSLPLNSNGINGTHTGKVIQFGNHLDYLAGNGAVKIGLGAYIAYLNAVSVDNKYKENGEAIAEKSRFTPANLVFNSSAFKSTQVLLGPVASFGSGKCSVRIWAKAGYGLNEPSRYAVLYKENGVTNNIYVNQAGEHKNGLAYAAGAGLNYALSGYVALKLGAHYSSTQTDQVNYNFDREKGLTPLYYTAANQFIQLSAGLQFTIGNPANKTGVVARVNRSLLPDTTDPLAKGQKIKTKSNIKNDRVINTGENEPAASRMDQKIKTKSNIKNDRLVNTGDDNDEDSGDDSLFFSPEKIAFRTKIADMGVSRIQLQTVDNYLTGFAYRTAAGNTISQCGANEMPADPIPGVDVRLRSAGGTTSDVTARTNRDGSFSFNNIVPGDYRAELGESAMDVIVKGNASNDFKILDVYGGSCNNSKENYVLAAGDKTYVEVISAREASSGLATGKKHVGNVKYEDISRIAPRDAATGLATGRRMHKPYRVVDTDFDVNMDNIVSSDGKLYAEVITAREASSGMASGRRTLVTGDVDGDGLTDYSSLSPRDAASGLATGKRMHKPFVITKEINISEEDAIVSPRDAASGLATGRRMHKPFVITKEIDMTEEENADIVSPRDAASGLPTGKRMHKPFVITKEINLTEAGATDIVSPRDAASGMPTGKRMHKPFIVTIDDSEDENAIVSPRDPASGLPTGRRQYKPILVRISPDDNAYEILTPRDAASGMPTGKRMHKPFVITKELGYTEDGDESVSYKLVWGDPHVDQSEGMQSNPLYHDAGNSGTNLLFESGKRLYVTGGNGKGHDIFIPSDIMLKQLTETGITANSSYDIMPVKWAAPELLSQGKSISEKGIKRTDAAERKGWDGTVKGNNKNINTSEDNLGSGKSNEAFAGKGWDGSVKGSGRIKEISRVHCADGTCTIDAIVEAGGASYEAVISGVMKTRHDTVKNSIGNIR